MLRKSFVRDVDKRFNALARLVMELVFKQDVFGIGPKDNSLAFNYDEDQARDEKGQWTDDGGGGGEGKEEPVKSYKETKGTDKKVNKSLLTDSRIEMKVSDVALQEDAEEAVAHVLADKNLAEMLKGSTITVKDMGRLHGLSKGKNLYVDAADLKNRGPGFVAATIRHEVEHSMLTKKGVPSAQQERRVRYTAGLWALDKYSIMAKTNPRAAKGFKEAAKESGLKVNVSSLAFNYDDDQPRDDQGQWTDGGGGGGEKEIKEVKVMAAREAVIEYQKGIYDSKIGGYTTINNYLRTSQTKTLGTQYDEDEIKSVIAGIDAAFEGQTDAAGRTLVRGVRNSTAEFGKPFSELKVGDEYGSKTYTSTSTDSKVVVAKFINKLNSSDRPVTIKIETTKDTKSINTDRFTGVKVGEKEILLQRDIKFKVMKIKGGSKPTVTVKIVSSPTSNSVFNAEKRAWQFRTSTQKLNGFNTWFAGQVKSGVLQVDHTGKPWLSKYVESSYRKGRLRAYMDSKPQLTQKSDFYEGSQREFLESAFNQPERVSKVEFLSTRTFEELKGITATMSQQVSRSLAQSIADGSGAEKTARELANAVIGISRTRARVMARTELIAAHADGQLDAFEDLGATEVKMMAEWMTAGDDHVCDECEPLEGVIMPIDQARGLIPRHPNCRCAWMPADVGEDPKDQKRGQSAFKAIRQSVKAEAKRDTTEESFRASDWQGKLIKGVRPPVRNVDRAKLLDNLEEDFHRACMEGDSLGAVVVAAQIEAVENYSEDQPRDEQGRFGSGGGGGKSKDKEKGKNKMPPALSWQPPPSPTGSGGKAGGFTATGHTNTEIGDLGEVALTQLNMQSILPEGHRQNPLDVKYDGTNNAYEVKTVTTASSEYKVKMKGHELREKQQYAKKNGYKPGIIMLVLDVEKGTGYAYRRQGLGNFRLSTTNKGDWEYMGSISTKG